MDFFSSVGGGDIEIEDIVDIRMDSVLSFFRGGGGSRNEKLLFSKLTDEYLLLLHYNREKCKISIADPNSKYTESHHCGSERLNQTN